MRSVSDVTLKLDQRVRERKKICERQGWCQRREQSRSTFAMPRGVAAGWLLEGKRDTRRRVEARFTVRANYAMQPTACAVGKEVKCHGGLAPAAADGGR